MSRDFTTPTNAADVFGRLASIHRKQLSALAEIERLTELKEGLDNEWDELEIQAIPYLDAAGERAVVMGGADERGRVEPVALILIDDGLIARSVVPAEEIPGLTRGADVTMVSHYFRPADAVASR